MVRGYCTWFWVRVLGLRAEDLGSMVGISGFRFRVAGLGFSVEILGFLGLTVGVSGFDVRFWVTWGDSHGQSGGGPRLGVLECCFFGGLVR